MGATKIDLEYFETGEFKVKLTEIRASLESVKSNITAVTFEDFAYNDELNQVIDEIANADELAGKLRDEMYELASNWESAESASKQIADNLNYSNSVNTYQASTASSTNISNSDSTYYNTNSNNTGNTNTVEKVGIEDNVQNEIEKIEDNSIYGENATQYGGNQHDVSNAEFIDDPQMRSIVEKYYGDVSEEEMEELLNACTGRGCGYVAVVNTIFYEYNRKRR